jgi:alkanesulfonate monooxygenase SsuD/methylene tetrahydromethanopterin reductase-like flavin-dependent oxidoreductase (luciferase family)
MLRLAGETGDGVILNLLPPRAVPQVLAEVRRGAEQAGRDADAIDVVARITVCSEGDGEVNRNAARRILAGYVTSPVYEAFLRWIGLGALLNPVVDSWRAGDREGALRAVSDELIDTVLVVGDAAHCRSRIGEYREAGVRVPCVMPFSGEPEMEPRRAAIRRMVRQLAPPAAQP